MNVNQIKRKLTHHDNQGDKRFAAGGRYVLDNLIDYENVVIANNIDPAQAEYAELVNTVAKLNSLVCKYQDSKMKKATFIEQYLEILED